MAKTLFRQWFEEEAKEDWEERPLSSIATFFKWFGLSETSTKK
jgi:hypothetical protein